MSHPIESRYGSNKSRPICRLLIVEDDIARIEVFRSWIPERVRIVHARSAGSAIGIIQRDRGDVYAGILLDHDLQLSCLTESDRQYSGKDVVQAIIGNISRMVPILVHSVNESQGPVMYERLKKAGFDVIQVPMNQLRFDLFKEWIDDVLALWDEENISEN